MGKEKRLGFFSATTQPPVLGTRQVPLYYAVPRPLYCRWRRLYRLPALVISWQKKCSMIC